MVEIERFDDDIVINPDNTSKAFAFDIHESFKIEETLSEFEGEEVKEKDGFSILKKREDNNVGCFECGKEEKIYILRNEIRGDLFLICDECYYEVFKEVLEFIDSKNPELISRNI